MQTQYWLELLVPEKNHAKIGRLFGQKDLAKSRSLMQVFHQEYSSDPGAHIIHSTLDNLELQYESLDKLKVSRESIAFWINCQTDTGNYELEWDPVTLMRLGEDDIKMCVRCGGQNWDLLGPDHLIYPKWVEIEDIWIESSDANPQTVYVSFDDGTLWFANIVTYTQLEIQLAQAEYSGDNLHGQYFWQPHMLLVESCSQDAMEQIVLDLLKKRTFERAFFSFDPGNEILPTSLRSEISMIHEEGTHIPLQEIFNLTDLQEVIHTRNYCKIRQATSQSPAEHLMNLLQLLENNFSRLGQYGIQRHDIAISLVNQYEGQVCLEFDPALMERLGRNGITLQLFCTLAERDVARTLA